MIRYLWGKFLNLLGLIGLVKRYTKYMNQNPLYSQYQIGEFTYGHPRVVDDGCGGSLRIGKYCSIAEDCKIVLGSNHRVDWISTYPFNIQWNGFGEVNGHPLSKGDVVIGNDVWIAGDVMILSGVVIGDGAVIAAGAVVSKNVEPYSIVGGVPARLIRYRFEEEIIESLMSIKWWDRDVEKVRDNVTLLQSNALSTFIESKN